MSLCLNVLSVPKRSSPHHPSNSPPHTTTHPLHLSHRNSLSVPQVAYFYPFSPRPTPICHAARHVGARCCQSLISHCVPLTFPSSSRFTPVKYITLLETGGDLGERAALAQVGWQAGVVSTNHNDVLIKPRMSAAESSTSPPLSVHPEFSSFSFVRFFLFIYLFLPHHLLNSAVVPVPEQDV